MEKDIIILISTCERYRPVAEWTRKCIDQNWENHPPVRVCGLQSETSTTHDSRDWMSLTLEGVNAAHAKGIKWIYLILDDLPPVGLCASRHLNETLPKLAEERQAVNIGLLGWGQRRGNEGVILSRNHGCLLRNNPDYRWKFSLHPGLWSVSALRELLEIRRTQFPPGQRTPWNFERRIDLPGDSVPPWMLENTYRVHGNSMAQSWRVPAIIGLEAFLAMFDIWRFLLRILRGQTSRENFDRNNLWLYHYYRGPYPIFWSGAVRQGKPHQEFEKFLKFTMRHQLLHEWRTTSELFQRTC